ncbi:multifunctional expression regulator [Cercopithecine betaherpesvirus 5]|uniref:mRNA export factor ICP27 homolog n=1 Tax=Simian cytomegalovirus (strain Colburn) TaxID=50292 RepID=G8XTD0_SCMVC|nr:multifunctional expression regulator [Cercopithecine betaherpesvirus 5]AEV80422.1 multifunctional expression regulator [Cercopithecine betaherpesvirus 5]
MSFEREERAHFRENPTADSRSVTANHANQRHGYPAHSHIYSVSDTLNSSEHATHPQHNMDLHQRYRSGPALSQLSDRERRARRARRFCLDHEDDEHAPSFKRPRYEQRRRSPPAPAPVRDSPESPPPGPDSGRRPASARQQYPAARRENAHHHHHQHHAPQQHRRHNAGNAGNGASSNSGGGNHATVSPATSSNQHMLAINHELDSMNDEQLLQLSRMIDKKKEERQRLKGGGGEVRDDPSQPSSTSPVYDLQRYTAEILHLTPYPDDLKKPTAFPQDTQQPGRLLISHEELMNTDYLLNIRQQFDWLSPSLLRRLVIEKSFSVFNAPSLHGLLAMVDETLSYIKFHFLHGLPVNPYDPYMATVAGLRQLLFNKLNNLDLPCILDNSPEWSDNCQILKNLVKKPNQIPDEWTRDDALDLQKRPPESFQNPVHRAMAYLCSFSRAVTLLRRRSRQVQNAPHFLDQFDDNGSMGSYRCGMVSELILNGLHQHQCQNELCELRIQKGLQPYQSMLAYCPFDTKCLVDLTVFDHDLAPVAPVAPPSLLSDPVADTAADITVTVTEPHSSHMETASTPAQVAVAAAPSRPTSGVSPLNRHRTVSENPQHSGNHEAFPPLAAAAVPAGTPTAAEPQQMPGTTTDMPLNNLVFTASPVFAGQEISFSPQQQPPLQQQQQQQQQLTWPQLQSPPLDGELDNGTVLCSQQQPAAEPDWVAAISALSTLPDSAVNTPPSQQQQQPVFELFTDSMTLRCQTPEYEDMCYSDNDDEEEDDEGY